MIEIGQITINDAQNLATLQAATFRQAYADVHTAQEIETYCRTHYTLENARKELSLAETVCCIGWLASKPSGYYLVKHHACPIPLEGISSELKQIYVLSSAYGKGLGAALFDHAVTAVRSSGSKWVWLCVSDINYRAQAFYMKLGFAKVGSGPILQVGRDSLSSSILTKDLREYP